MASSKKAQGKAGLPAVRRGQQMGDERTVSPNKQREAKANTPALRGRHKDVNKFYADDSAQQVASEGDRPRSNSPSIPAALPTETKLGEPGYEKAAKLRQSKPRKAK
ncbi:MAG TPA: hypothetical protein VM870_06600 [Pyrinomonadaceae bacterium]|nr:hypothetical protein [Pyrinomonadaceae bacterium]